jgi:hypothetical protein
VNKTVERCTTGIRYRTVQKMQQRDEVQLSTGNAAEAEATVCTSQKMEGIELVSIVHTAQEMQQRQ